MNLRRYGMPELKQLARKKFEELAQKGDNEINAYTHAIRIVYETTPRDERGLRDVVAKLCKDNFRELATSSVFTQLMDEVAPFSADLAKELVKIVPAPNVVGAFTRCQCPNHKCKKTNMVDLAYFQNDEFGFGNNQHCAYCGRASSIWRACD